MSFSSPRFYVIARVVGRDGSFPLWKERLGPLCKVSATEQLGTSYYWAQDLDGEPNTTWGLEGYSHPVGFFIGHQVTDIFKREMALIDKDELLKHEQGLKSRDYDLKHYDYAGGWLKRSDDPDKDSSNAHIAILHLWLPSRAIRVDAMKKLSAFSERVKYTQGPGGGVQSVLILKEIRDVELTTLWIRTKTANDFRNFQEKSLVPLLKEINTVKTELHQAQNFIGHLDKKPLDELELDT